MKWHFLVLKVENECNTEVSWAEWTICRFLIKGVSSCWCMYIHKHKYTLYLFIFEDLKDIPYFLHKSVNTRYVCRILCDELYCLSLLFYEDFHLYGSYMLRRWEYKKWSTLKSITWWHCFHFHIQYYEIRL